MDKVMVIGVSPNPIRYSNRIVWELQKRDYEVVPIGIRNGTIDGLEILTKLPEIGDVDLILLYLNSERQEHYYDYILRINPRELLFNPGTWNGELAEIAEARGILVRSGCALVLLEADRL